MARASFDPPPPPPPPPPDPGGHVILFTEDRIGPIRPSAKRSRALEGRPSPPSESE
jgi:hypothetical protein